MTTEHATGDASRLYQAMLAHLHTGLWNDIRNARTLAWMVSGALLSQRSTLPNWLSHINAGETLAQSTERRFRRWLENPAIDSGRVYDPLITRALRNWGQHTLILALDTSVLFETFCLIRVAVLFRGRAGPLVSRVIEHSSAQVSTAHLLPVLAEVKGLLSVRPQYPQGSARQSAVEPHPAPFSSHLPPLRPETVTYLGFFVMRTVMTTTQVTCE